MGLVHLPDYQHLSAALACEVALTDSLKRSHKISFSFTYYIVHDMGCRGAAEVDRENSIQILYCDFCEFDALELPWDGCGSEVVCAV